MVSPSRAALSARRCGLASALHEVDGVVGGERERRGRRDEPDARAARTTIHAQHGKPARLLAFELRPPGLDADDEQHDRGRWQR